MFITQNKCLDFLFDNISSPLGVVPEPASEVEEATKVKLTAALPLPTDAFTLPATPWWHHILLTLLGTQWLLRWVFEQKHWCLVFGCLSSVSLSAALEIGGNFLGLVMIPFKLLTAELSSDFSLPGVCQAVPQ